MASFGSFETQLEVYSGPTYSVYRAKKSGDPTTEYAIKLFSFRQVELDPESAGYLESLLSDFERSCVERIALQQRAAEASENISPIFETGHDERGVWYATSFYPRSINKIISGRVVLTREALHHFIRAITQGAADFKRVCGRSHGDLQPSVVQISRSEKIVEAKVVLSDPLPGGPSEAAVFELSDLHAIGRILLQLVLQREFRGDESDALILPILSSPQWTQIFGKDAEDWLALTNQLLDPNLAVDQFTLEHLLARLRELQPKAGVPPKMVGAALVAIVILGGLLFWLMRPGEQKVEVASDPPGASVYLNQAKQEGKTPLTLKLKPGTYAIEARHETLRLLEQSTNWVARKGGGARLQFHFPYGSIAIKSEPGGATITREDVVLGTTPADGSPFVIPIAPAGIEEKFELALAQHLSKTVRGVVTNGQQLLLTENLPLARDSGTVEMTSEPAGAKVFLKDKLISTGTPEKTRLEQGTYTLTAIYEDWPPTQLTVEVKKGVEVSANFYFQSGTVLVRSEPAQAVVYNGANRLGPTPLTLKRPVGKTTFRFELPGFETTNETVTVTDKATVNVKPTLLSTNGVFEFSSELPAAVAILDANGKELGRTTPGNPLVRTVAPGTYSFTARAEGLGDAVSTLTVKRSEMKKHVFVFDYGTVRLESEPSGAAISLEGRALGQTPATFPQKPGAVARYRLSAPDYLPTTAEATVQNREFNKQVAVKLLPEPVSVVLASDPPGAQFYLGSGPLSGTQSNYLLPWGTRVVTARFARLRDIERTLSVVKGAQNRSEFRFDYGTVVLTNLLDDTVIKEGNESIVARPGRVAYEPPGEHTYDLFDGGQKVETLTTNVASGLVTVLQTKLVGEMRNSIGMRLVKVRNLLGPSKDGWVGKFEVTQGEFQKLMGSNPSIHPLGPNYPVENVTWEQAMEFCQKMRASDEQKPPARGDYKLPTKAQWVFFANGTRFEDAVVKTNAPAPVGSRAANPQRLHDVLGNVWEWLADSDDVNGLFIGSAYNVFGFGLEFGKTEQRKKSFSGAEVGFRIILVPTK